ncbi:MAG: hypothetical protein CMI53_04025 [Parcubacteria group bacterium]|jgi:hypothetical protein|nr:hypothetical protein [Parcubacteria group bacterium]|tara:strand:- start:166 stop:366 length:201 start_codon:yes stop_codon:yes gene_type:complete
MINELKERAPSIVVMVLLVIVIWEFSYWWNNHSTVAFIIGVLACVGIYNIFTILTLEEEIKRLKEK